MWDTFSHELGELLTAQDWAGAEALLRRFAGRKDTPGAVFYNLGKVLMKRGKAEQSGEWFRRAVATDPNYPPSWFELGRWNMSRRAFAEARDAFREAGRLMPQDQDCLRLAGRAALALGDWQGAADAYAELRKLAPGDGDALLRAYIAASELRSPEASTLRAELLGRPELRGAFLNATIRLSSGRLPLRPQPL